MSVLLLTHTQMIEDDFDIKKKVEEVLTETGFMEQRAAKLGVDELLKYVNIWFVMCANSDCSLYRLLSSFHDAGIHFA